jgi:hypothetical protein
VPTRHRPHPGDRIDAAELVAMTPAVPRIPGAAIYAVFYIISALVVATVAYAYTWIAGVLIIPAIWLSSLTARHIDPLSIGNFLFTHWTARRVHISHVRNAPAGRSTTARGIKAGNWVYLRADYDEDRRKNRAAYGHSAPPPSVDYKLVMATFPLDGHNQLVAFSDGESITWNPASAVLFLDQGEVSPLYPYDNDDDSAWKAARTLIALVGFLYNELRPVTIQKAIEWFGDESDARRALFVAQWWNLVTCTYCPKPSATREDNRDPDFWLIQLSWAGRNWYLASCTDPSTLYKERRNMSHDSSDRPSINIGTFTGILTYAGKNVSGSHTANISQTRPSDNEVLSWLETVLELNEIPWSDHELTDIRHLIEEALEQKDPQMSGLKQAIVKLGSFCQQIAIGVAGNGAYQLLIEHFK